MKEAFLRLHEKGLIYRGTFMVNWSPHLQTAVSDIEVCPYASSCMCHQLSVSQLRNTSGDTIASKTFSDDGMDVERRLPVSLCPDLFKICHCCIQVDYTEDPGTLYYFKYPVVGSGEHLPVATTRPETILGDTAVAVHPEDTRYRHLVGKECEVPMSGGRWGAQHREC